MTSVPISSNRCPQLVAGGTTEGLVEAVPIEPARECRRMATGVFVG